MRAASVECFVFACVMLVCVVSACVVLVCVCVVCMPQNTSNYFDILAALLVRCSYFKFADEIVAFVY